MRRKSMMTGLAIALVGGVVAYALAPLMGCGADDPRFVPCDTVIPRAPVLAVYVPDSMCFAGEPVPLHHFDVRESLDRELTSCAYWHTQTMLIIKKADRFFSIIEPILRAEGLPDDFKYLAIAESNLVPTAVSPSNAVGLWQILEPTAKELGLEVGPEVDERYHVEKSTVAACRYLKRIYERTGSWTMAAASYNNGPNGLARQVARQGESCYYNLLLNTETARYVFRILAFKAIIADPQRYGFMLRPTDIYPRYRYHEVQVDSSISDLARFARQQGVNYKMLKTLNPWLRDNTLTNKKKRTYAIKIATNRPPS
ncbi:MAG: lytic transglycosylase domain-containing protein [Bacteroidales bacterium]|nr:lytic transglycosylase domain-containing protein [Bacteroidales bacterium]